MSDQVHNGNILIKDESELGQVLKELNSDELDPVTRTSGIDMRARLEEIEISSILVIDALTSFRFLPMSVLSFTRAKKRLSVSKKGEGRKEIVDIVRGDREHDVDKGGGGIKRLFGFGGDSK